MIKSNSNKKKKSIFLVLLISFIFLLSACGNSTSNSDISSSDTGNSEINSEEEDIATVDESNNVLVTYFSYSGTTKGVAEQIANLTGGDLEEIERATSYESDTYTDVAEAEIQNGERPEITIGVDNIDAYDVIMVGYPVWYEEAPAVIATFLESFDFDGKIIVPFCTSSSDTIDSTLHIFSELCPDATIAEALTVNNEKDIEPWLETLGLLNT